MNNRKRHQSTENAVNQQKINVNNNLRPCNILRPLTNRLRQLIIWQIPKKMKISPQQDKGSERVSV